MSGLVWAQHWNQCHVRRWRSHEARCLAVAMAHLRHLNTNETVGSMYISFKLLQYLQMLHKLLPTCSIHNLFTTEIAPRCCRFGSPPLVSEVLLTKSASWLPHERFGRRSLENVTYHISYHVILIHDILYIHVHPLARSNDVYKLKYHSSDWQILTFTKTWNHKFPYEDLAGCPHNQLS